MNATILKELVQFFEDRNLSEVADGLRKDLKDFKSLGQQGLLTAVRKAVSNTTRATATNERNQAAPPQVELLPQQETEEIMENLLTKMVHRPTLLSQQKDKAMNKKIEEVFELECF